MRQTKGGIVYNQKDIVLMPFPYSDLTDSKLRPALIISNEKLNKTQDRICCLITSNEPKDGELITESFFQSGNLPFKSWVKPHRLFTINEKIIKKKLCTITDEFHDRILSLINNFIKIR